MTSEWHKRSHRAFELLRAKRSASERADGCLLRWGGLTAGLPLLLATDSTEGLRELVGCLVTAGRDEDLHRLLACEQPAGPGRHGVVNVWFDVHHRLGDVAGYLQDLEAAHQLARAATDADLAAGRAPSALGLELRYTVMKYCAEAAGEPVSDELAVMLAESGLWEVTRAVSNACRNDTAKDRCRTLLSLLPYVPEGQKRDVVRRAMADALIEADNGIRASGRDPLVDEVAPMLSPEDWPAMLSGIEDEEAGYIRTGALTALSSHLPVGLLHRALTMAAALPSDVNRTIALRNLAPRLPAELAVAALPAAREISEPEYRAQVLTALLPQLPADAAAAVCLEARDAIRQIGPPTDPEFPVRRWRWTGLIPLLPIEERSAAITEAAGGEQDAEGHADLLVDVAVELPAEDRAPLLADALSVARGISDPFDRAQTLIVIAEQLPPGTETATLIEALTSAHAISESFDRAQTLSLLADRLPATDREAVLDDALTAARSITDDDDRAYLLTEVAGLLPIDRQGPPLAEAVRAAHAVKDDDRRFSLLLEAAELLTGAERRAALSSALDIRRDDISSENYFNGSVLDDLAPALPEDLMIEVLEGVQATGRRGYLARVLYYRANNLTGTALEAGLAMARAVTGKGRAHQRAAVLKVLSDQLPAERRVGVLEEALAAAREAGSDLTGIARRLPSERRVALLKEQLTLRHRNRRRHTVEKAPAATAKFAGVRIPEGWGRDNRARESLVRAQRAHRRGADPTTVIALIRQALASYNAIAPPTGSPPLASAARDLGGPEAMDHYLKAAADIHRWWP
ncbi:MULTISPECIES: hypothetical protein [unclassified Kribbella]|uniref:hypothetical protein n=1 Tax=unclassified Kribbella TaxID=2644121 RepID=UPI00301713D3